MALGLWLYFNQLFYIVGIDMSGVVVATCMQPTIPVFTAMIAVLLNLEAGSLQKFIGITLAVGGSICMVSLLSQLLTACLSPGRPGRLTSGNNACWLNTTRSSGGMRCAAPFLRGMSNFMGI